MDEEIGKLLYTSKVWTATHAFLNEQVEQDFRNTESSKIYISV